MARSSTVFAASTMCLLGAVRLAYAQPPPAPQPPPGHYQPPPGQYQPPPPGYGPPGQYQPPPPGYGPPPGQYQPPPPGYGPPPGQYQPPPPGYGPPPGQYQPPPPGYGPPPGQYPPPGYGQPYYPQQPPPPPPQRPPPMEEPEPPTHAPKFSLWVGPRLSYMGFGFGFYTNDDRKAETTGNLVGNGMALQLDVGARISHRYIPHIFWEHGFLPAGHRFNGESGAGASTDYYGIGFRYLGGDVDSVAFLTDIAIGRRVVTLRNNGETYTMYGLEIFKLGLGAEIRAMTLFTIEPVFSISGGSLNDTEGTVTFAPGQGDGVQQPPYRGGRTIDASRPYVMLSFGVGVHFDVFGK
ncbi:MAG: hypothetical protein KF819_37150 [Labilithrix sp.]|nr:hypothetical protein [Labilithrix sp.]